MTRRTAPLAAIAAVLVLAMAGCDDSREPAGGGDINRLVADIAAYHKQAGTLRCELLVRVKPPQGDALLFTLIAWSTVDGRVRLRASKLDVDFCEVLVQANGDYVANLVRDKKVVKGNLGQFLPPEARGEHFPIVPGNLARAIEEIKCGPLPVAAAYQPGAKPRTIRTTDPATGLPALIVLDPVDLLVVGKTLFDEHGGELLRFEYSHYKTFDILRRPSRVKLVPAGDATEFTVGVSKIDILPGISDERMTLAPLDGAPVIGSDEFLRTLSE